uniref:SSD domain-containing protein n=1 Tax=Panagrellus redivivus TaxID=6233 RepID=A0A7E4VBD6_PANRE
MITTPQAMPPPPMPTRLRWPPPPAPPPSANTTFRHKINPTSPSHQRHESTYAEPFAHATQPSTAAPFSPKSPRHDQHQLRHLPPQTTAPPIPKGPAPAYFEEFRPIRVIGVPAGPVPTKRTSDLPSKGPLKWYSDFLYRFPGTVCAISLLIFCVIPLAVLVMFPLQLSQNPEKGFDTRGTDYANARLTWAKLQPFLLQGSRVIVDQPAPSPTPIQTIEPLAILESRSKGKFVNRTRRSFEDELASLSAIACYEIELLQMDYMAQVVLELPSYETLFDLKFHKRLCGMQSALQDALTPFSGISPYRSIFHFSNYAGCLSPSARDNCSSLTGSDVRAFRIQLESCARHRKAIIECGRDCIAARPVDEPRRNCDQCERVPSNCTSQMWFDLFYRVLPVDIMRMKAGGEKIYLNTFLPLYTFSSYAFQGFSVPLEDFLRVEKAINVWDRGTKNMKVKGYLLDIKRDVLFDAALADSKLAIGAAAMVFILMYIYSLSLGYTLAVFAELGASVLAAGAVYRAFTADFPILNLVAFVLLLSIGSDGAFLLFNAFPSTSDDLDKESLHDCLRHTVTTMFLAQFSTVVPFMLNLVSSVIAFRSFGLFAGLTLIINYFLLITLLPAYLVLHRRYLDPFLEDKCCQWYSAMCAPVMRARRKFGRTTLKNLPSVLIDGRYFWLFALLFLIVGGGWLTATQLGLPQYNPLQLFTSQHPYEWYDNHAEQLFEFVSKKIALPLAVRLLWGFETAHGTARFDPDKVSNVTQDPRFELKTVGDVRRLAEDMQRFRMMDFTDLKDKYWPERFLDWSAATECSDDIAVCCNVNSKLYADEFLDYCMRVSTSQIVTGYNDTPIYHNVSFDLVGYTALLPTKLKYSHKYQNLSASMKMFEHSFVSPASGESLIFTTEWTLMSTWYDLQRALISDSIYSILASLAVVSVFALIVLRWHAFAAILAIGAIVTVTVGAVTGLGWELGVLEAVILVLVVSLSFDYTLHYGAAVPRTGCKIHRIETAVKRALAPVSMAALSSFLAGVLLLMSKTHAFFQVATFLVLSGTISWLFATFFYLPLLSIFLNDIVPPCDDCEVDMPRPMLQVPLHVMRGGNPPDRRRF